MGLILKAVLNMPQSHFEKELQPLSEDVTKAFLHQSYIASWVVRSLGDAAEAEH